MLKDSRISQPGFLPVVMPGAPFRSSRIISMALAGEVGDALEQGSRGAGKREDVAGGVIEIERHRGFHGNPSVSRI